MNQRKPYSTNISDRGMRSGKGACKFYIYESDSELFILAPFPRRHRRFTSPRRLNLVQA